MDKYKVINISKKIWKYIIKTILFILLGSVILYFLIDFIDPIFNTHKEDIDESFFLTQIEKLEPIENKHAFKHVGENYIIYVNCTNTNELSKIMGENESSILLFRDKYYEFDENSLIKMETGGWHYLPILDVIEYKLFRNFREIMLFYIIQGSEVSINYRYLFSMAVEKDESNYMMHTVLKHPKYLNEAIEAFVNYINGL